MVADGNGKGRLIAKSELLHKSLSSQLPTFLFIHLSQGGSHTTTKFEFASKITSGKCQMFIDVTEGILLFIIWRQYVKNERVKQQRGRFYFGF